MAAPDIVTKLVDRFERNKLEYKSSSYNEAQVRQEFINPFFYALGWDMNNEQGFSEAYKEVIHEASLKVGGSTKAPDYGFRVGSSIKFLVEAKKPSVNLEDNPDPAIQLRSYAWNAKLPISILTDFEELVVYDCRYPPKKTDKAHTARIMYLSYEEYLEKWDEISGTFSKKAIYQGSFDRFAEATKSRKGTKEVDIAFLEEITSWRDRLARNIANRNTVSFEALNASVQATIDRIVFLRICEDRGIEKYGQIQEIAKGENIYAGLCELFKHADDRYNSGLFHFKKEPGREFPDLLALDLKIDDNVLKEIVGSLYPPSPYNFAVISPEILGQVYEQFLGKVIRLTDGGHRAKVEDKPEVKKAGGVKYTPVYIVQYIVRTTLEPLLKGKTPREVAFIYVLDPACGSGSFLLGAYQYLLDWHLDWYIKNLAPVLDRGISITTATVKNLLPVVPEDNGDSNQRVKAGKRAKSIKAKAEARAAAASIPIYKTIDGDWHLTIAERKRILLNNIYGVDIDRQAVEVTKLSLLLKVLEGENQQTVADLLKYSRERVLPDLEDNIKCGNSLVRTDIYHDSPAMSDEERTRINPFDWISEFPEVMQGGGFHAVIGNPPYVRQELLGNLKNYYKNRYSIYSSTADLYTYFIERGLDLLRPNGIFSYIVANKWMRSNYGEPVRKWLKSQCIEEIIDFGDLPVFLGATTYPCIIRIIKKDPRSSFWATLVQSLDFISLGDYVNEHHFSISQLDLDDKGWSIVDSHTQALLVKLHASSIPLSEYVEKRIYRGILTGMDKAFVIDTKTRDDLIAKDFKSAELIKPYLAGRDIQRYEPPTSDKHLILIPKGWTRIRSGDSIDKWDWLKNNYSAIANHLQLFADEASKRYDQGEYWWELRACDYYDVFEKPKIIYLKFQVRPNFTFDINEYIPNSAAWIISANEKYILGILNSKLGWFMISNYCTQIQNGYQLIFKYLGKVPIHTFDPFNKSDKILHDRIVEFAESMLQLHKQLGATRTVPSRTIIQRQIEANDKQIDRLVYELYGLTEEEINIVEGA